MYRASTEELRKTWPACFWCAGIAPRDKEVHAINAQLTDFNYEELDPPMRTAEDAAVEFHRPDHHGKLRMVVAGDRGMLKPRNKNSQSWTRSILWA